MKTYILRDPHAVEPQIKVPASQMAGAAPLLASATRILFTGQARLSPVV